MFSQKSLSYHNDSNKSKPSPKANYDLAMTIIRIQELKFNIERSKFLIRSISKCPDAYNGTHGTLVAQMKRPQRHPWGT